MAGKGSKQRKTQIDRDKFESNWDKIFGNKSQSAQSILEDSSDAQEEEKCQEEGCETS